MMSTTTKTKSRRKPKNRKGEDGREKKFTFTIEGGGGEIITHHLYP